MHEKNLSMQEKNAQHQENKIKKAYAKPELIDLDDVSKTKGKNTTNPTESGLAIGPS